MHGSASCRNGWPEFEDIYDLLTDFRFGGYRILGDIVCDMEDENTGREKKSSCSVKATQSLHRHDERLRGQIRLPELP